MARRVAVLVVASLVASMGVLVGSEAVVPPLPVAALPSEGVSVLAGTGTRGYVDGSATTAQFDAPADLAVSPDGEDVYVLDIGYAGRPNTIRKVDTATGAVTTFASGGLLAYNPMRIEVDPSGNVWVSIDYANEDLRLVRFSSSGTPTTMVTGISNAGTLAFTFDPSGQNVFYANKPTGLGSRRLHRLAIPGGTVDADTGTDLGGPGRSGRDDVGDFAWSPQGELYMSWGAAFSINAPGLYRWDGGASYTEVRGWISQRHRFAFTATGGSLNVLHNDGTNDWLLRIGNFGAGPESILAGHGEGDDVGVDGQLHDPRAVAFSPDGAVAYIADESNFQVRQVLMPPDPWELSPDELCGPCNRGQNQRNAPQVGDPVDVATGNLTEFATDLALPGRGPVASASRTYNSHFADKEGIFGPGWSSPLDATLEETTATVTIFQENGAALRFAELTDGTFEGPGRVTSTLEHLPDGSWRLDRNQGDIVTFDEDGQVTGWEDRNGNVTAVSRPSASQIVMTTSGGRSLTFSLASGVVTSVSDDSTPARTVTYSYDTGRLAGVESFAVNPGGTVVEWGYHYDTDGRLDQVTDPRGNSIQTHYDVQGRVDHQIDYAGAQTDFAYGGTYPNEWRTITHPAYDASGTRTVVRYELDRLITESVTSGYGTAAARTLTYEYDPDVLGVTKVTGPGPTVLATFAYDANGNVTTSADAAGRTTTVAYADPLNPTSPTTVTDHAGNVSTMTYDDAGNLESTSTPVKLPGGTVQGTAVTTLERDPAHPEDVTAVVAPDQQGLPTPKKSQFSYRAGDGQLSWAQDPEGNRTTYGYDSRGFVISTVTPRGNATGTVGDYETTFTVNDFGMVQTVTDPTDEEWSQLYDGNGNTVLVVEPGNTQTTTTYDEMNRPRVIGLQGGGQTETTYFPNGAVREQIDGAGEATGYTYDVHGAVASSTDPLGRVTGYRYDTLGRLTQRIDPGGTCPATACTTYGYAAGGDLATVSYSDPATPDITAVGYDTMGRRTSVTRSAGAGQTWAWDSVGRLRSSTDVNGRTTAYGYTLGGNLSSITYPGQTTPVSYTYDAADRMTSVTDWAGRATQLGWSADSQWTGTTFPSATGTTDTRAYDEAGRLASVEWKKGATSLGKLTYDRPAQGLLGSETPTGGTFSTRTWTYGTRGELIQENNKAYGHDEAGNLVLSSEGEPTLAYDAARQICWTSLDDDPLLCDTPPDEAAPYTYDARGNRTAFDDRGPAGWTYGYDQESRMTSATERGDVPIAGMSGTPVAGDFDGDADDDVFWYHPGTDQDWMSWGEDVRGDFGLDASPYTVNGTAYQPFSGDFDGDGHEDIFWYGPGAAGDSVWFWDNDGVAGPTSKTFTVSGTFTPVVGDFDADGASDIYWYAAGSAVDYIWWGGGTVDDPGGSFTSLSVVRDGSFEPIAGDFDNNGADDIVWYQPGASADAVWFSTGVRNSWVVRAQTLNATDWDLAVGDFDGDGKDDLFLTSSGGSQVWWGTTTTAFGPGLQTWTAHVTGYQLRGGDFDGDGYDDLLLYDPAGADTAWWGTAVRTDLGTPAHRGLDDEPTTATYSYDSTGLRNAKTVDGTDTQFTWATAGGLPLLLGQHQGSATTNVVYGPGGTPLYEVTGTTVTYYHQDQQGSTRLTTNGTGAVIGRYGYEPYGTPTTNTAPGGVTPLLGYTGQLRDAETGFSYLRARYMDPATGQFTTRDPLVTVTRDPYSYAGSDPINHVDPSGLFGIPGTNFCVDIADPDCNSVKEQHQEGASQIADTAAGVLNGVTGGNADTILDTAGQGSKYDSSSAHFTVGSLAGTAAVVAITAGYAAAGVPGVYSAYGTASTWASAIDGTYEIIECIQGQCSPIDLLFAGFGVLTRNTGGAAARLTGDAAFGDAVGCLTPGLLGMAAAITGYVGAVAQKHAR